MAGQWYPVFESIPLNVKKTNKQKTKRIDVSPASMSEHLGIDTIRAEFLNTYMNMSHFFTQMTTHNAVRCILLSYTEGFAILIGIRNSHSPQHLCDTHYRNDT